MTRWFFTRKIPGKNCQFRKTLKWLVYSSTKKYYGKTAQSHIMSNKTTRPLSNQIEINNNKTFNVKLVQEVKYLGIWIDIFFKVKHLIKKKQTFIHRFNKLKIYLPIRELKMFYTSLVENHISYAITVWGVPLRTNT